jgi:phosphocarrier protein HPr
MVQQDVIIVNVLGLHARAAARFVQVAEHFRSRIQVSRDGRCADGKSILGLLALLGSRGAHLTIAADGSDEQEALRTLCDLVKDRFGEDR